MLKILAKASYIFLCAILIVQFTGCGTILHPERKGQSAGRIDAGIAILDGIGLLCFLIPGIIAFAVDFNNGTIYLPGGSRGSLDLEHIDQITFDPRHITLPGLERIIEEHTGTAVKLDQSNVRITELASTDDMIVQFEQVMPSMSERIALSH